MDAALECIVTELEKGVRPWIRPWSAANATGRITRPLRHNGQAYTGMNVLLLWSVATAREYLAPICMTSRQASEVGAHVRKGEASATVIYASRFTRTETDARGDEIKKDIPFLKAYGVFNIEQIDGLPEHYFHRPGPQLNPDQRIERADRYFANTGAVILHGGRS